MVTKRHIISIIVFLVLITSTFAYSDFYNPNKLAAGLGTRVEQVDDDELIEAIILVREDRMNLAKTLMKKNSIDYTAYELSEMMYAKIPSQEIKRLTQYWYIEEIWPNLKMQSIPTTESYDDYDNLAQINAYAAWNLGYKGDDITIAILDTGIDSDHQILQNKVILKKDFTSEENPDPEDHYGHGTHCAGIATGNGYVNGVAPNAKLINGKVLSDYGYGNTNDLIEAIEWAVENEADIISLSLGSLSQSNPKDRAVEAAIKEGVVVVAAAGNDGNIGVISPGSNQHVITVGAVDQDSEVAYFSSYEDFGRYSKPDVVAPGVSILSSIPDNQFQKKSGTSMATPHVAGAAALLKQKNPDYTHQDIKQILIMTAKDIGKPGKDIESGYGLIDIEKMFNPEIECFVSTDCSVPESETICRGNNVYEEEIIRARCLRAGTEESSCSGRKTYKLKERCEYGCSDGVCRTNNDDDGDPDNGNPGDDEDDDNNDDQNEIACYSDDDCGKDKALRNPICKRNDVYQFFEKYTCVYAGTSKARCIKDRAFELIQECSNRCRDGECV